MQFFHAIRTVLIGDKDFEILIYKKSFIKDGMFFNKL